MSAIEWTDRTWNPVRGCSRVSRGCEHCYAERIAARFNHGQDGPGSTWQPEGAFSGFAKMTNSGPRWTGRVELIPSKLKEPFSWREPRRVFVNSMSDLFHEALPDGAILRVFEVMARCPQHTFQILTKRPARMLEFCRETRAEANIWLGVSVEDQATTDERIPLLLQTPAAVRFVSYEPAIGPVDFSRWMWPVHDSWPAIYASPEAARAAGATVNRNRQCLVSAYALFLDWLIVGGESGPGARPFDLAWARSAIRQCREAGVPCFVKQLGRSPTCGPDERHGTEARLDGATKAWTLDGGRPVLLLKNAKGGDILEWPSDLRVREFPR